VFARVRFALTGRPVILYQDDREAYTANDRQLYFDVDDSPYWVATNESELHALFENLDRAKENCEEILEFYGASETGRAAGAVAKYIAARLSEDS
jgi:CDP-glycerol glycerophosphotransferase (TagB/SpsB family)